MTVREALRVLAQENILFKVQGRGTFVANHPNVTPPSRNLTGYLEDLYDQLDRVSVKQIDIVRVPVTDDVRSTLALGEENKEVVRIKRTRYVDDQPYAFTINILTRKSEAILVRTVFSKYAVRFRGNLKIRSSTRTRRSPVAAA